MSIPFSTLFSHQVRSILKNLNTHGTASLYTVFPPAEAKRLADRLEIHFTPKHGSWLNIAEIELSVLKRQCLTGRIDCIEKMRSKVSAWNTDRNNRQSTVDWQFKTDDTRIKLKRLYPKFLNLLCTRLNFSWTDEKFRRAEKLGSGTYNVFTSSGCQSLITDSESPVA